MNAKSNIKNIVIEAKIIRKDGTKEDLGIISNSTYDLNIFKKFVDLWVNK